MPDLPLTRKVLAKYRHLTKEPMESSDGRASICLSTGLGSRALNASSVPGGFLPAGEVAGCCCLSSLLAFLLVERPFLNLLKDSLSDFLNDFLREIGVSPAPVRSRSFEIEVNFFFFVMGNFRNIYHLD